MGSLYPGSKERFKTSSPRRSGGGAGKGRRACNYSRLPIIRTLKGNRKKFELSGVRVVEGKIYGK